MLGQFGSERTAAVRRYEDLVRAGVGLPPIWERLNAQIYLGSGAFADEMAHKVPDDGRLDEVPRLQRRPQGMSLQAYVERSASRDAAIAEAAASGAFTLAQLAQFFGLHYSSISRIVAKDRKARQPPGAGNASEQMSK